MANATQNSHSVHKRKKRLLDSLQEIPESVDSGLAVNNSINEQTRISEPFHESNIETDNEDLRVNQRRNSCCCEDNPNGVMNLVESIEEREKNAKKYLQLTSDCVLNGLSEKVLKKINERREEFKQIVMKVKNAKNLETKLWDQIKSEISTLRDKNCFTVQVIKTLLVANSKKFDGLRSELEAIDALKANLTRTSQMVSSENDIVDYEEVKTHLEMEVTEKMEGYLKHLERLERVKAENLAGVSHILTEVKKLEAEIQEFEEFVEERYINVGQGEGKERRDLKTSCGPNDDKFDAIQIHNPAKWKRQERNFTHPKKLNNFECNYSLNMENQHLPDQHINITENNLQSPKRKVQIKKEKIRSVVPTFHLTNPPHNNIIVNFEADENGMVVIGPNGTTIAKTTLESIKWSQTGASITRKILREIFGRETLASHNLSGKPSPAFIGCNKPLKNLLDPLKVADIIHFMTKQTDMTDKEVRIAITVKCADESKLLRMKEKRKTM